MKWFLAITLAVVLVAGTVHLLLRQERATVTPTEFSSSPGATGAPTFTWSYREYSEEDIPHTEISLMAHYENGSSATQIVDRIEGNCNAYENADADVYERSQMIICYYAGLGRYYKVVEHEGNYLVQRKEFEEASPDYSPPVQSFQTIVQF